VDDFVEVTIEFIKQTNLAVLVTDQDVETWIPKSQIRDEHDYLIDFTDNKKGDIVNIRIPEWLAMDKGLI
jgi:hypothetical protein